MSTKFDTIIVTEVDMIEKKFRNIGNSWGVIIPKAIIEGLGINPVLDKVEIYIKDNEIRIRKIQK